jgi:two-component system copper resistance phosphate regulon response regulator CusR
MRILLVEDDLHLRASISRGLREATYQVDVVGDGVDAVERAMAPGAAYDAVILDVLLPGQDGVAVCRSLRQAGSPVPVLMLTALDAVEHRITGLDAWADDYLVKPFDFGELLARLRALTRRRDTIAPELMVGDLTIDTRRRGVRRGERDIAVTAKEYAFLLYLARNAGRVVSRAELMSHVWDDSRQTYSNIIDVYASRLRRKIDEGEDIALFSTLRGAGYMLAAPDEQPATPDPSAPGAQGAQPGRRQQSPGRRHPGAASDVDPPGSHGSRR